MPDVYPLSAPEPRAFVGWSGTHYYVVRVDAQGNLRLAPGGLNLRQYAAEFRAQESGAAGAGNITVYTAPVAAGRLLVATGVVVYISAGSATSLSASVYSGAVVYNLQRLAPVLVDAPCAWSGLCVVAPGEQLRAAAMGVGAGTTCWLHVTGYYVQ